MTNMMHDIAGRAASAQAFRRALQVCLCMLLLGVASFAQGPGIPTRSVLDHFRHIFMNIANLHDNPTELQRRERTVIAQFRLNEAQAKALHSAAEEFQASLVKTRDASSALLAAAGERLTDADRARLTQLATIRDQMVLSLADRLMKEIGPEAAQRMLAPLNW